MLSELKVKNYALISDIHLKFHSGLNIITGETGAGKSILISSLGLVLGNRADISALRNQENKCIIEATFDLNTLDIKGFFASNDLDYDKQTIIRREITPSGKSRTFINDTPVNLKTLSALGSLLIEIHSQYDNLQLFTMPFQFSLLDTMAKNDVNQAQYYQKYKSWVALKHELEVLKEEQASFEKEQDFNQFLFDELEAGNLQIGEESELEKEQQLLDNAESLIQVFQQSDQLLSENETAVMAQLVELERLMGQGGELTAALLNRLKSLRIELDDISSEISSLSNEVEVNPARLDLVNDRLSLLFNLKSKHRAANEEELIEQMNILEEKLLASSHLDDNINKTESKLSDLEIELDKIAVAMHAQRANSTSAIAKAINDQLETVGMPHSKIDLVLSKNNSLGTYGYNNLELMLSSDKGRSYNALKKSASGGELSRINLVVKNQLAQHRALPSSIFDEIDTGVSGEVARKVGGVMTSMAKAQQVIVITHLAQIASLGNKHYFVYKRETANGVETHVKALEPKERIHEIAKMISGENLTESALEQSKTLLNSK